MGKISGSYESVVRGVSEQAPQARRSGQHFAQVNMVSDPVRGLCRRHGSIMQDERRVSTDYANLEAYLADTAQHRVIPFFVGGNEYDLIVRTGASTLGEDFFAFCFDKEARQFIDIVYNDSDSVLSMLFSGGVSASANIGRYLYLAGNSIQPEIVATDAWGASSNSSKMAGWIRGGAYSRKFTVTLTKSDNTTLSASYTTKPSSYQGTLDTSDILASDTEYQKKVNDRVNAYNGAVTAWIGEAAADIVPENIAQKLVDALIAAGATGVSRIGAYVVVNSTGYKELRVDDGGDGSLARGVGNTVDNIDLVSAQHYVGKIVQVAPDNNGENTLYLKAIAKDGVSTGWSEVVWRETAGYLMQPNIVFCMATIEDGTLYMGGGPAALATVAGVAVPDYKANTVGDDLSSPLPSMFGKTITYMGVFQDRLVIGSGSTLLFSRPGDYLNWFRKSVLTVNDDDPWEGYALGSEDDTIRYGTTYDRNLLLYGKRFQYQVTGRQPFTPKTASIVTASAYEDAVDAAPMASGNFVFYTKYTGRPGQEVTSMHQVQPGIVADNSESYLASQQLDTYLRGKPIEILPLTAPNMVLLRTTGSRQTVYIYSYLDNPGTSERLLDSWGQWTWDSAVGHLMGLSKHEGDIIMYTIKSGTGIDDAQGIWVGAEQFTRETSLAKYPHLDSLRPLVDVLAPDANAFLHEGSEAIAVASAAIEEGRVLQFVGDRLTRLDQFADTYIAELPYAWAGIDFDAYVTPTNPYARDRNGNAILTGRLTLGKITVSVEDTGGMQVTKEVRGASTSVLNFTGRILGDLSNLIGRQPIVSAPLTAFIGAEVRDVKYTLAAVRWLPLTVTSIEWTGQLFLNTRRA